MPSAACHLKLTFLPWPNESSSHPSPPKKPYRLIEVSNECDVHLADVNTTMVEVTALHKAVADRLHADFDGASGSICLS